MSRNVPFITNAEGHKTAVILPIDEWQELLEDMHLIRVARERKDDERIPWEQIRANLVAEDKIER